MRVIASNYNFTPTWLLAHDYTLYDRSDNGGDLSQFTYAMVPNRGSDIYDKLTHIINHYHGLPEVALYTKANLFKYISIEEFNDIRHNRSFTPVLTRFHKEYSDEKGVVCFYKDGIYWERNDLWFIGAHPLTHDPYELMDFIGTLHLEYIPFAPGSNYILTKEDVHKHPIDFYIKLRSYLADTVYGGECMIIERGLYMIWR